MTATTGDARYHGPMPAPLTLQSLPLFPLGTVLYPGGLLPLRIFEVRYLDMIGKCDKNGSPFGVVALTQGAEVRRVDAGSGTGGENNGGAASDTAPPGDGFAREAFHDVGTLATISTLSRPQAGLMVIQCTGTQRFVIRRRDKLKHGLWTADVELIPHDQAVAIPSDLQDVATGLHRIIDGLAAQGITGEDMPFGKPYAFGDCAWVANRWCELLQLPLHLKQQLMALENPLVRLELIRDMLDKAGITL